MARLYLLTSTSVVTCGTSIISEFYLLTAAHCVHRSYLLAYVTVGSNFISKQIRYNVSKSIVHPLYDATTVDYDIAILKVEKKFEFSKNISPIKIADDSLVLNTGDELTVLGWGNLKLKGNGTDILKMAKLKFMNQIICQLYRVFEYPITERMLCLDGLHHESSCFVSKFFILLIAGCTKLNCQRFRAILVDQLLKMESYGVLCLQDIDVVFYLEFTLLFLVINILLGKIQKCKTYFW